MKNKIFFENSLKSVLKAEGLYSNDIRDSGGETYKGIARKMNPNWKGWLIIDKCKKEKNFLELLEKNTELQNLVSDFYYKEFWVKIGGEKIKNGEVSSQMFDTAVNMGCSAAIKFAEKSLGLNETGKINDILLTKLNDIV